MFSKDNFIANKSLHKTSYPLYVNGLRNIAEHYRKKYNIKIIINGDTVTGQAMIAETTNLVKRLTQLNDLERPWLQSLEGITYVATYWQPVSEVSTIDFGMPCIIHKLIQYNGSEKMEECQFSDEQNRAIQSIILKFLLDTENNVQPLTADKIYLINRELQDYFINSESGCFQFMRFMQKKAEGISSLRNINLEDICLNKIQVSREIDAIRQELKSDEFVGYIFTEQSRTGCRHKEPLIVSKTAVVKPVHWHTMGESRSIKPEDVSELYVSDWLSGMPQTTEVECGSLSVLYLKELLQDNAMQLKQYSLRFSLYSNFLNVFKPTICFYYFPSPQVLRYSQSGFYNQRIAAMLQDTDVVVLEHKGEKVVVETLRKLLNDSMIIALKKGDNDTYVDNEELRKQLPVFRKLWLEEYQKSSSKRNLMNDQEGINRYLAYHSMKMGVFFKKRSSSAIEHLSAVKHMILSTNSSFL